MIKISMIFIIIFSVIAIIYNFSMSGRTIWIIADIMIFILSITILVIYNKIKKSY